METPSTAAAADLTRINTAFRERRVRVLSVEASAEDEMTVTITPRPGGERRGPKENRKFVLKAGDAPPPSALANAVRLYALGARRAGTKIQTGGEPLPDDAAVRRVTHPHTDPTAEIGTSYVAPTATVEARAKVGEKADVERHAVIGRLAEVEDFAWVPRGTVVPMGRTFEAYPEGEKLAEQTEWIRQGRETVKKIDSMLGRGEWPGADRSAEAGRPRPEAVADDPNGQATA